MGKLLGARGRKVGSIHGGIIRGQGPKWSRPVGEMGTVLGARGWKVGSIHGGIVGGKGPKSGVPSWGHLILGVSVRNVTCWQDKVWHSGQKTNLVWPHLFLSHPKHQCCSFQNSTSFDLTAPQWDPFCTYMYTRLPCEVHFNFKGSPL